MLFRSRQCCLGCVRSRPSTSFDQQPDADLRRRAFEERQHPQVPQARPGQPVFAARVAHRTTHSFQVLAALGAHLRGEATSPRCSVAQTAGAQRHTTHFSRGRLRVRRSESRRASAGVRSSDADGGDSETERLDNRLGQQVRHRYQAIGDGGHISLRGSSVSRGPPRPRSRSSDIPSPTSDLSVARPQIHITIAWQSWRSEPETMRTAACRELKQNGASPVHAGRTS